ncbi:TetR/AcrR family transcriptional regulator [Amnibacterium setariae]|uniref:TetR/AcrR family transcriptional regulator n=1 Tax=Amnibacterium setariae TaxID=2306585 RepID=A0A3A1U155_9MICO|nr:TetR/AcrR family transcriptional regulator [Amnibacterium setariae]RIX28665.1 TetR/AcrR family transcriptional regulator [Amnibacterium setariae]
MATIPRTRRRPALERVVKTADRLFYANGIHATGVDTIADEANVSKASMYTYFRTKDDLVGAYVEGRSLAWRDHLTAQLDAADFSPEAKILMVFDLLGQWFTTDEFNGCPFINAEAESTKDSPAHDANVSHRSWIRGLFADLSAQAGVTDPTATSTRLAMLYDGAMVGAHTEPAIAWATEARAAAALLLH